MIEARSRKVKMCHVVIVAMAAMLVCGVGFGVQAESDHERRSRIHDEFVSAFDRVNDFHGFGEGTGVTRAALILEGAELEEWLEGMLLQWWSEGQTGDEQWDDQFYITTSALNRYRYALDMYLNAARVNNVSSWDIAVEEMNREWLAFMRAYDDLWARYATLDKREREGDDWSTIVGFWGGLAIVGFVGYRWRERRRKAQLEARLRTPLDYTPFPTEGE